MLLTNGDVEQEWCAGSSFFKTVQNIQRHIKMRKPIIILARSK